jgi:tRNA-splicing ligase RtcB (3'-phosphate/5'-hydroxy nucleic acid ligase)
MPESLQHKLKLEVPTLAWLTEPLSEDIRTAIQRLARAPDVHRLAIMPDVHLSRDVCVGVAVATHTLVYPQAVGADIGCGITTMPLHASADDIVGRHEDILRAMQSAVPILRHPLPHLRHTSPVESLGDVPPSLAAAALRHGIAEFATLGRGNHFMELQADENQRLWLAVHSGSRALGQVVFTRAASLAKRTSLWSLDSTSELGQRYLDESAWCVRYAELSRRAMLNATAKALTDLLGIAPSPHETFGSSHNFVDRAIIDRKRVLIHRKGASSALGGAMAVIPGSMGSRTYHITGRAVEAALLSCSHGAGRVMSRTEARTSINATTLARELRNITCDARLGSALLEEAPSAYRDIRQVMRAQSDLVRIDRTLNTLVCHKGA